jgi:hypothetical protein
VPFIDEATGDVVFRITYQGANFSGRWSSLDYIWKKTPPDRRTPVLVQNVAQWAAMRAFTLWPTTLPPWQGRRLRFDMSTYYGNSIVQTHEAELIHQADAVVWVVDSMVERLDANIWRRQWLAEAGVRFGDTPLVLQHNKRDLPHIVELDGLNRQLNPEGFPSFETVAITGYGIFDALKAVVKQMLVRTEALP